MKVGFIGSGIMGKPMARNLLKAGFPMRVHNRSPKSVDELVADGVPRGAARRVKVAAASKVIITMLPDSPDLESVVLGPDGALEGMAKGTLLIDMGRTTRVWSRCMRISPHSKFVRNNRRIPCCATWSFSI